MLHTDEARQYEDIEDHGYGHDVVNHSEKEYVKRDKSKCGFAKNLVNSI